jgi:hypothetical protein
MSPSRPLPSVVSPAPDFAQMADLVQRAAGDWLVDRSALLDDLRSNGILSGGDDDEEARCTREFLEVRLTDKELAKGFRKLAKARDPLDRTKYARELWEWLSARMRKQWPLRWTPASIVSIRWEDLSEADRAEIRDMCRQLERMYRHRTPPHRPHKNDIHTLIHQLADIFASHTKFADFPSRLPHSPGSRFIQFASLALAGSFADSEVSPTALGRRWRREKVRAGLLGRDIADED